MHGALLLDALGTLVSLQPPGPLLRAQLAQRWGIEVSEAQARGAIAAEIAYYRAHFDEGSTAARLVALRRCCAEAMRAALPASRSLAAVDTAELTEALLASLRFVAFPDAHRAIRTASAQGRRVIVVSNWDISLAEVLQRLELAPLVDGIVTSAQVGVRKPAPAIFARALRLAGVGPAEAIHVGDNFVEDVLGARALGIEAVLIRRDGAAGPDGVRTIASLDELGG
jgi:putative hydrolase of the HAD superfamily